MAPSDVVALKTQHAKDRLGAHRVERHLVFLEPATRVQARSIEDGEEGGEGGRGGHLRAGAVA